MQPARILPSPTVVTAQPGMTDYKEVPHES